MIKRLLALVLAMMIALSSCSVWDFIKPSSGIAVDTEIVAGDKEISTEVVNKKTTNTADTITQVYNTVNEESNWITLVGITLMGWFVGWITKTPVGMFNMITGLFRRK